MLHSSSQLNGAGGRVSLFRETVIVSFFCLVSFKFLALVAWTLGSLLLPVTENTMSFYIKFSSRPYLRKNVAVAFFFLFLSHVAVSYCKAGVCLHSAFRGGFQGLFFWSSLCVANGHLLCACCCSLLVKTNFIFFPVSVWVSWYVLRGQCGKRQLEAGWVYRASLEVLLCRDYNNLSLYYGANGNRKEKHLIKNLPVLPPTVPL